MLLPKQFTDMKQTSPFLLIVEEVKVDGVDVGPTEISISYDEGGKLLLSFEIDYSPEVISEECEIQVKYKADSEPLGIFLTERSLSFENAKVAVEARFFREPVVLIDRPSSKRFEAVLLSGPKFLSKTIILFDGNGTKFEIEPFKSEEGASCLIKSDINLKAKSPLEPLEPILDFLTFAKGSYCGLGNLFTYDEDDSVAFRLVGFSRNDREKRVGNWFDIEIQNDLPEIFLLFSAASTDELTKRALRQTIAFYRASNASRSVSIEMSIIAAHTALEAIVNYTLAYRAGWSKSLLNNRTIAFADKNRAAALHFGIHNDLLSQSPRLAKYSKEKGDIDLFEIISQIRNKLVHQDNNKILNGIQLHETWLAAQWLVEILIFGVIGYRGAMMDRRIYSGWRGTTYKVPLGHS
jgi:hypothetical protein